jgi:hypothetical protein
MGNPLPPEGTPPEGTVGEGPALGEVPTESAASEIPSEPKGGKI